MVNPSSGEPDGGVTFWNVDEFDVSKVVAPGVQVLEQF